MDKLSDWYRRNSAVLGAGLRFILILAIFLTLLTTRVAQKELLPIYAEKLAALVSAVLRLFGIAAHASGIQIRNGGFGVQVSNACLGVYETSLISAAILATPTDWMRRIIGIAIAALGIYVLNIARASCLFVIGLYNYTWFRIAHEYIFEAVVVCASMAIYMVWANWAIPKIRHAGSES